MSSPIYHNLILNARIFDRRVVQWYFRDWDALDQHNTRIWEMYYRPKPLYDHVESWEEWLPEYRQLIIEVQEIWEGHRAAAWCEKGLPAD